MPDFQQLHHRASEILTDQTPTLDLSEADTDEMLAMIRHWAITRDTLRTLAGRLIAELQGRGYSTRAIADDTGFAKSTVDRWAAPYTRNGEQQ